MDTLSEKASLDTMTGRIEEIDLKKTYIEINIYGNLNPYEIN